MSTKNDSYFIVMKCVAMIIFIIPIVIKIGFDIIVNKKPLHKI